jgi:hypothetical protein
MAEGDGDVGAVRCVRDLPGQWAVPVKVELVDGHSNQIVAVDAGMIGCYGRRSRHSGMPSRHADSARQQERTGV